MASLLLVTGPPGAGKSTVAEVLAQRFYPSVLVSGDAFFSFLRRGAVAPWLTAAREQNHVVTCSAAVATGRYVDGGYTAIYDGIVGPWYLDAFAGATGLPGLHYVVLLPSADRCLARVAGRLGHGFTDADATRHMHQEFSRADVDPRHVLVDPPDEVGVVADRILAAMSTGTTWYGA